MSDECHQEHLTIYGKLDGIEEQLKEHVDEVHESLLPASEIVARDAKIEESVREALLGPKLRGGIHDTGARDKTQGIQYKVDVLWRQTQNGGIPAKLSKSDRAAIYTIVAGVLIALGERFFG